MSGKFTPGPWKIVDYDGYGVNVWNVSGNKCIAERCKEANARLIAAAPDMYEALKAVLDDVQFMIEHGYIGDVMDDILYVHARAALAKADGTP